MDKGKIDLYTKRIETIVNDFMKKAKDENDTDGSSLVEEFLESGI